MKKIYFDMDGTIADFYGVDGWLDSILKRQTKPYREAKPLINMRILGNEIKRLQKNGYSIGIISWLAKGSTQEYDMRVQKTKIKWLQRHLGSVQFDEIHIVEYGTPKQEVGSGILFDDEKQNRIEWNKIDENFAFNANNILQVLENLV